MRRHPSGRYLAHNETDQTTESMSSLVIKDLHATVDGQEILRGLTLEVEKGKVHAIMGQNGSGKSTLSKVIGGHPDYTVTSGEVLLDGENILGMEPDER